MNENNLQPDRDFDQRFESAMQQGVSEAEAMQFRRVFETAWRKRTWMQRITAKPLTSLVLIALALTTTIGAGYSWMQAQNQASESKPAPVVLMPGQRIVEEPELLSLLPKVENPTLIMDTKKKQHKETYLLHGYMHDKTVQMVWEY